MPTTVFVDTSAFYAALVADDRCHGAARAILGRLEGEAARLVSSSFVLQETIALLQARHGVAKVRIFHVNVLPLVDVIWIGRELYDRSMAALLGAASKSVSLTDWSSFEVMRTYGIDEAFAFDSHFAEQGFTLLER